MATRLRLGWRLYRSPALAFILAVAAVAWTGVYEASGQTLKEVIEGAKKEGVLKGQWSENSFGGSAGLAEIVAGMNKKWGLNLKGQFTPGPDMQRLMLRISQEEAAGQPASTDVYLGNSQAMLQATKSKVLKPFEWAKILPRKLGSEGSFQPIAADNTYMAFGTTVVGVQYNTDMVKGADIPRKLEDVLNPKWKGKIASTPYAAGLREFATADFLGREYVIEFTKKLSKQIGGLIRCGEAERITSGEFLMLVMTCGGNDSIVLGRTGAPLGHTLLKEGTVLHTRYAGVPKNSRSPNAGALLAAYLHTPEGQAILWKYDGIDFHLHPDSHMRKEVEKVRAAGGRVAVSSPEWLASQKDYQKTQKELEKILREGGK
ncbi:MAG: extracellular solute-binding protein [Deltaproteobacteria bacterium]|nr:extracellular solute-binding protein [Deltaproteobacteria bacterium]MBI2347754.1 extracellular solute-binding protein [Deltaproteobacteria bacterium]